MNRKLVLGVFIVIFLLVAAVVFWRLEVKKRADAKIIAAMNFKSLPFSEELQFRILKPINEKCWVGDSDAIEADTKFANVDSVLLTIESLMDPPAFAPVTAPIPMDYYHQADELLFKLPIPKSKTLTPIGIFVCRDQSNSHSCKEKQPLDIVKLYLSYYSEKFVEVPQDKKIPVRIVLQPKEVSEKFVKKDRNYFFQYAYLTPNGLKYPQNANGGEAKYLTVFSMYEGLVLKDPGLTKRLEKAKQLGEVLRSMGFTFDDKQLDIRLPRRNPACMPLPN